MPSTDSLQYTAAGRDRMERFLDDLRDQAERAMREKKFVPGETTVEITASDIEELTRSMRVTFLDRHEQRYLMRRVIVDLYLALGFLTVLWGVFYTEVRNLFANPVQSVLLLTGVVMMLASLWMRLWMKRAYRSPRGDV